MPTMDFPPCFLLPLARGTAALCLPRTGSVILPRSPAPAGFPSVPVVGPVFDVNALARSRSFTMPSRERKEYHAARLVEYVNTYKKVRYCLGFPVFSWVLRSYTGACLRA